MGYQYLLDLALILASTKFLGLLSQRFRMPQVVGALVAGLIFGPAVLGFITDTDFIKFTAELGVIVLMFTSGMETDINELKRSGKAAFIIALLGVALPLAGGYAVGAIFNPASSSGNAFLENIFLGIILTATSVSITVETLRELGKLRSRAGSAILGAAIIDDVLGIVALTVVTSFSGSDVNVWWVLAKIVLFFVLAIVIGFLFSKLFRAWILKSPSKGTSPEHAVVVFVFCLALSFVAEHFFGVADITGAFLAGLILSNTGLERCRQYLAHSFETVSFLYLSPVFFTSIGLQVELDSMSTTILLFALVYTVVAVISKILGCGLGAKFCKYSTAESIQIGVGMISRGEVALIVANKGAALNLISTELFGPVVVVVVVTTIVTPILLKVVFRDKEDPGAVSEA